MGISVRFGETHVIVRRSNSRTSTTEGHPVDSILTGINTILTGNTSDRDCVRFDERESCIYRPSLASPP